MVVNLRGYQEWKVPIDGLYKIEAYGAQGGFNKPNNIRSKPGKGAYIKGEFNLNRDEVLYIAVGQQPVSRSEGGGGGGGTFVVKKILNSPDAAKEKDILVIAAGGAGSPYNNLWGYDRYRPFLMIKIENH